MMEEAPPEMDAGGGGGGGDGMDFAVEDDGQGLADFSEEAYADFNEDPFAEGAIEESDAEMLDMAEELQNNDPFAEENEGEKELSEIEEMLGLDFKWQYIFAPWEAATDSEIEKNKVPEPTVIPSSGVATQAVAVDRSTPAQKAKMLRAQQKLAAVKGRYAPHAMSQQEIADEMSYAPTPSETFADRLALSKQAQSIEGEYAVSEDNKLVNLDDVADLLIDSWTQDITDTPADPMRRTASLHHGAAYLEERSYPRHGASSGQEGGIMFPREVIHVGEKNVDSYETGADILGAGPTKTIRALDRSAKKQQAVTPRAQFVKKSTAGGKQIVSLMTNKTKSHKKTIANARDVAKRAVSVGTKLGRAVAKGKVKPVSKTGATRVRGVDDEVFYGVIPAKKPSLFGKKAKGIRPKLAKRLSPAQLKKLSAITVKAGKDLAAYAAKHDKMLNAALKKENSAKEATRRKLGGKNLKATRVRGDEFDAEADEIIFGAEFDVCFGDVIEQAVADEMVNAIDDVAGDNGIVSYSDPQPIGTPAAPPSNPGYGASDPGAGYDVSTLDANDPNWGFGPMPTMESIGPPEFTPDPGLDVYWDTKGAGLPEGAIIAPSDKVSAKESVGSRDFFKRGEGLWWQGEHWNGRWGGWDGVLSDFGSSGADGGETEGSKRAWTWLTNKARAMADSPHAAINPKALVANLTVADLNEMSQAAGWGPLVSNPRGPDKGLRYDPAGDQWYWFWNAAPKDAQAPGEQLRLAQAINEWKMNVATAKTDAAAQAIQDQIDAEEARAIERQNMLEDAALARQQEQEAAQAMHDADVQALADEAAARQEQMVLDRDLQAEAALAEIERANRQQEFEQDMALEAALAPQDPATDGGQAADVAEQFVEETLSPEGDEGFEMEDLPIDNADHAAFDTGEFNLEEEMVLGYERTWEGGGRAYFRGDTAKHNGRNWIVVVDKTDQEPGGGWFSQDWQEV